MASTTTTTGGGTAAADQAARCFTVTDSQQMPDFNGMNLLVSPNTFNDTITLDAYLTTQIDTSTAYLASFREFFDCDDWDGSGQRFHLSYFQGFIAFTSNASCPQTRTAVRTLCRDTCDRAQQALSAIFSNPRFCAVQDPSGRRQNTITAYANFCRRLPQSNCVSVVSTEAGSCGFPVPQDAAGYCRLGGQGAAINDQCCLSLTGDARTAAQAAGIAVLPFTPGVVVSNGTVVSTDPGAIPTGGGGVAAPAGTNPTTPNNAPAGDGLPGTTDPFSTATAATAASGNSNPPSSNRSIIIGAVVAAVTAALILGIILFFILSRRRNNRAQNGYTSPPAMSSTKKRGLFGRKYAASNAGSSTGTGGRKNRGPSYIPYNATAATEPQGVAYKNLGNGGGGASYDAGNATASNPGSSFSFSGSNLGANTTGGGGATHPESVALFSSFNLDPNVGYGGAATNTTQDRPSSLLPSPKPNGAARPETMMSLYTAQGGATGRESVMPPNARASVAGSEFRDTNSVMYAAGGNATPAGMFKMQVVYDYTAAMPDELDLQPGDIITVTALFDDGWGHGILGDARGAFPLACVAPLDSSLIAGDRSTYTGGNTSSFLGDPGNRGSSMPSPQVRMSILDRRSSLMSAGTGKEKK
ncbi:hypothetical protein HDU96_007983 [Phlyctochytrium bullatum]|nr:hypothetical protein HDU96_007983 [Phlyctochytrium bullatum]